MSGPDNTRGARDPRGRWVAGKSGNPGGRPSTPKEMLDFIGQHTLEAAHRLVDIMRGKDPQQARLAAEALLDRRLGKPAQALDVVAHRGPDVGGPGGDPEQARARLEALIATEAGVLAVPTVDKPVSLPQNAESLRLVGESDEADRGQVVTVLPPGGAR